MVLLWRCWNCSTDDIVNSMTAINTRHYNIIELSYNEHTILLESNESLEFTPFNTNVIVMRSGISLSIIPPQIIQDTLSHILFKISTQLLI